IGPGVPKGHTPHLACTVWHAKASNVSIGVGVLRHIRRVRVAPNAVIVVLLGAIAFVVGTASGEIGPKCINAVEIVASRAQQSQRVEVRPAFAEALRLNLADSHATTDEALAKPVCVLMQNNLGIEAGVSPRAG